MYQKIANIINVQLTYYRVVWSVACSSSTNTLRRYKCYDYLFVNWKYCLYLAFLTSFSATSGTIQTF